MRYQRQAKFIGSAIVSIPLPTCTLRDRMLVKVLYIRGSGINRSFCRIKDKESVFGKIWGMPARDVFHDAVKHGLIANGWKITHDPLPVSFELGDMYIDLGAEKLLAAQRGEEKIAVEIKSFIRTSLEFGLKAQAQKKVLRE